MGSLRQLVLMARDLSDTVGEDGRAIVALRAAAARQRGETEDAIFWTRVGRAMRLMRSAAVVPSEARSARSPHRRSRRWRLMQVIEHCRHRAHCNEAAAERAHGSETAHRLGLAARWRELAAAAEGVAAADH